MTTKFKCPTEGCTTEMDLIEVNRVYGEVNIDGIPEPVRELIIDQPVGIFYCPTCSHSIIVQKKAESQLDLPTEPKIILTT